MRKLFYSILGLLVLQASYCQTEWKRYDYPLHDFYINFIQEPEFIIDTAVFQDAPQYTYNWLVSLDDTIHENTFYCISVTKYPSDFINYDSLFPVVEGFINSTQNSLSEDNTFSRLASSLIEKNGYPGKSFKWKNTDTEKFIEDRVFLINSTLFRLTVVSKAGKNHNVFIDKFFESFGLLNVSDGTFALPAVSDELNYAIRFPGEPKSENKFLDSEYGNLNLRIQILEQDVKSDNLVYIASQIKYPASVVDQDNTYELNNFYKKAMEGALASASGDLISINDVDFEGKSGKEMRCYYSQGYYIMVYRYLYLDEHLYSIGIITTPDKINNKDMAKFFNSFKIKK